MPASALVQTRIDPKVKARAAVVLGELGMTVSDAVRVLLTRTANEGALPFALARNAAEHDAWFRVRRRGRREIVRTCTLNGRFRLSPIELQFSITSKPIARGQRY